MADERKASLFAEESVISSDTQMNLFDRKVDNPVLPNDWSFRRRRSNTLTSEWFKESDPDEQSPAIPTKRNFWALSDIFKDSSSKQSTKPAVKQPAKESADEALPRWQEIDDREMRAQIVLKQRNQSLVLCDETYYFENRWYNTPKAVDNGIDTFKQTDLVDYDNELLPISDLAFDSLPNFDCLQRLKVMQICVARLGQIDRLPCLKQLEIGVLMPGVVEHPNNLYSYSLPSLQTLCIIKFHPKLQSANLKFNTPALESVCFGKRSDVRVQRLSFKLTTTFLSFLQAIRLSVLSSSLTTPTFVISSSIWIRLVERSGTPT